MTIPYVLGSKHSTSDNGHYVAALAVLPEGTLASGCGDACIRLWDVSTSKCLKELKRGPHVWNLAVLLNGKLASATAGARELSVNVWDTKTGQCLRVFKGHKHYIWCSIAPPDGTLVSNDEGRTIRL